MDKFPPQEYRLPFFKEQGFVRKRCPMCGDYYWTMNPDQKTCGEASSSGCAEYTFIGKPPTSKKYSLPQMREAFLSFFEKHGHARVKPYPVVARWRDDIYLTHASIIDFQPYVTEGISPPPANPLVISQPCIRMVDIANTGPTFGRHLTIFEMGGAHAFNYPDKEIYWKDQTVKYHQQWVTEDLGVSPNQITYKEGVWVGGGNAGPDVECIIDGLEVATLVFMQYKVVGDDFVKLPIRTVDTGYGIDRYAWLSQGVPSGFQAIYGRLLDKIFRMAGLGKIDQKKLARIGRVSGIVSLDKMASRLKTRRREAELAGINLEEMDKFLIPVENAFAIADHTKCLSFILAEGVVPSNIQEGYLARLIFRRVYRLLKILGIEDRLCDIMDNQITLWSPDYPHLKEMRNDILEMLKSEESKFEDNIRRGEGMIKRITAELKAHKKKEIPTDTLTELYDSHGLPPEIVKQAAEKEGLIVNVPDDFYALVAQRHLQVSKSAEKEMDKEDWLKNAVQNMPETRMLYYEDQYMREFEATVLNVLKNEYVVLDRTCFFPEGGGQPADMGYFIFDGKKSRVIDAQKIGKVIVHRISGAPPKEGKRVTGILEWNRRYSLMKNHTATHVIGGAARRVLGMHVWQYGTQKGVESSRLDISHYRRLTLEEIQKIEILANQAVERNIPVETTWLPRNEAESCYGFRLYQGGAIPGKEIRVVRSGDWDVEACAGTHVRNTGEIEFIKITHSERVQDGVERLTYSVGIPGVKALQKNEELLLRVADMLNAPLDKLDKTVEKLSKELKEANAEKRRLLQRLAEHESGEFRREQSERFEEIGGVRIVKRDFGEEIDVDRMVKTASELVKHDGSTIALFYGADQRNARILVMVGDEAIKRGVEAGSAVREGSAVLGGGGGGRPNFAQGGGTKVAQIQQAVEKAMEVLKTQVAKRKA